MLNIAQGCTLKKLLKTKVSGKNAKAEIQKLGEPYSYNVAHLDAKSQYDLYEADITYDEEEGTWGTHVIAIPAKQVQEMQKAMINRERGTKIASSIAKRVNTDNVNEVIAGLVTQFSNDFKLAKIASKAFKAAGDTVVNGNSAANDFWNELK